MPFTPQEIEDIRAGRTFRNGLLFTPAVHTLTALPDLVVEVKRPVSDPPVTSMYWRRIGYGIVSDDSTTMTVPLLRKHQFGDPGEDKQTGLNLLGAHVDDCWTNFLSRAAWESGQIEVWNHEHWHGILFDLTNPLINHPAVSPDDLTVRVRIFLSAEATARCLERHQDDTWLRTRPSGLGDDGEFAHPKLYSNRLVTTMHLCTQLPQDMALAYVRLHPEHGGFAVLSSQGATYDPSPGNGYGYEISTCFGLVIGDVRTVSAASLPFLQGDPCEHCNGSGAGLGWDYEAKRAIDVPGGCSRCGGSGRKLA